MNHKLYSAVLMVGLVWTTVAAEESPGRVASAASWNLIWSEEFGGAAGTGLNTTNWLYDIGRGYPPFPDSQWGTGEIETMTDSTANVFQDGSGHLVIRALRDAGGAWTSGRIETQRTDFAAPVGGIMAVEASIQQPNLSGPAAAGYWPAFWMLGEPFRGDYDNWPWIGEIDIMEDINGQSAVAVALHCGTETGGPCNETEGLSSGLRVYPGLQTAFHTYRMEYDRSVSPEQIRWYLDGVQFFSVNANNPGMDAATWSTTLHHGFFIILNVAIGGYWAGDPTGATASGGSMLVDYVRVYYATGSASNYRYYLPLIAR